MSNDENFEIPQNLYNREAERAVLGSILLDKEVIDTVSGSLRGDEFHYGAHTIIYRGMLDLNEEGQPINTITLAALLQERGRLEEVGNVGYLVQLVDGVPTTADVGSYVKIVNDRFLQRMAVLEAHRIREQAKRSDNPVSALAAMQEAGATLAERMTHDNGFRTSKDVVSDTFEIIEHRVMNKSFDGVTGISSGYRDLDKMTAGFQKSDLLIVAARPSVGKTAFALNIGQNVGIREKETVAIFSLEMSATQLMQRMVSAESNVDATRIRTGYIEGDDWEKLAMAIGCIAEANIFIDDSPTITVTEIRAKCRRLKKDQGSLGLILIDYLQLISSHRRGENRQQEVTEISRMLKQMARELDCTVIALSQLSRAVEQRQDKRPMLSDLRESGAIEQDADIVAFLYRDDYYNQESEKKNIIEIIIAKQRNGPVGTVELAFLKNFNKFLTLDRSHADEAPAKPAGDKSPIPDMYRQRA